ncbi:hypothetical protein Q4S15_17805 [Morganella morganii]
MDRAAHAAGKNRTEFVLEAARSIRILSSGLMRKFSVERVIFTPDTGCCSSVCFVISSSGIMLHPFKHSTV